jgi:hypothetical protein
MERRINMDEVTYEVDGDSYDTKEDAEDAIKRAIENGSDEDGFEVYKVTRESLDIEVEKEVTVTIND